MEHACTLGHAAALEELAQANPAYQQQARACLQQRQSVLREAKELASRVG